MGIDVERLCEAADYIVSPDEVLDSLGLLPECPSDSEDIDELSHLVSQYDDKGEPVLRRATRKKLDQVILTRVPTADVDELQRLRKACSYEINDVVSARIDTLVAELAERETNIDRLCQLYEIASRGSITRVLICLKIHDVLCVLVSQTSAMQLEVAKELAYTIRDLELPGAVETLLEKHLDELFITEVGRIDVQAPDAQEELISLLEDVTQFDTPRATAALIRALATFYTVPDQDDSPEAVPPELPAEDAGNRFLQRYLDENGQLPLPSETPPPNCSDDELMGGLLLEKEDLREYKN